MVGDLDLSWDDVALAVAGYHSAGGAEPAVIGDEDVAVLVSDATQEVIRFASSSPVGAVLGRRPDSVFPRSVPPTC